MTKNKAPKLELSVKELQLFTQLLYNARWNGQEWETVVTPLINKLAQMIDKLNSKKK